MPEDEGGVLLNKFVMGGQRQTDGICGADSALCRHYAGSAWRRTQEAAAAHNAPCTFTTFNAWEFSAMPGASKVHRKVILRNEVVPELPISWAEEGTPRGCGANWKGGATIPIQAAKPSPFPTIRIYRQGVCSR